MRYIDFKITEMAALSGGAKDEKYIPFVQKMLDKAPDPIRIGDNGEETLIPDKGQTVTDRFSPITGTINNQPATRKVNQVFKTPQMKAGVKGQEVADDGTVDKIENKGEVVEGILGAAIMKRLHNGKDISNADVYQTINEIKHGRVQGTLVKPTADLTNKRITDKFELLVSLKERAYSDFKQPEKIEKHMDQKVSAIVAFANDQVRRFSKLFLQNGKADKVQIVSDGVSNETDSKTDVLMIYNDKDGERVVKHFDLSVKTGDVGQFGQKGGGKGTDPMAARFSLVQDMFNQFGVNIQAIKQEFEKSENIVEAYKKAYTEAETILNTKLVGANVKKESEVLRNLISGIKFFGTLNDDRVKLVDFSDKGYYVLDFKRLSKLYLNADIDLGARVKESTRDKGVGKPTLEIYNKIETEKKKEKFFQIRMYMDETGYVRNYIEKGPLLKVLTKVRGNY